MIRYTVRRLLMLVPILFGISVVVFAMIRLVPGDPIVTMLGVSGASPELIQRLRQEIGLDLPIPVQYGLWLGRALTGDLGRSISQSTDVVTLIGRAFPVTLTLAIAGMIVALVIAVPLGVVAATRRGSWADRLSRGAALLSVSTPVFFLGLVLLLLFALLLRVLPPTGNTTQFGWTALILPALVLGVADMGLLIRVLRAGMIESLGDDYVRTARAKGMPKWIVEYKHALRNALLPLVTVVGLQFSRMLAGAVITETIFDMRGLGRLIVDSYLMRDYTVIQGAVLLLAVIAVVMNLVVDLSYGLLDPRVRY